MNDLKIIGVIPARGGSKGIPGKNIKLLAGKPLIAYSIEAAQKSKMLTRCIVSTDDEKIKDVALSFGGNIPFMRPAELATDTALAIPTIQHAVSECERLYSETYDYIVMLQPTAPLRTEKDIDHALSQLVDTKSDGVISVVDVDNWHPMKMKVFNGDRLVDYEKPPLENPPRQLLPKVYIVNGAIYATKRSIFMKNNTFQGSVCTGYIMPPERSVNIDTEIDFLAAEHYLRRIKER